MRTVAAVLLPIILAACTAGTADSTGARRTTVHGDSPAAPPQLTVHPVPADWARADENGISVRHPASWRVSTFAGTASEEAPLLFMSNRAVLPPPCTTTTPGTDHTSVTCRTLPRTHLRDGDVLIAWFVINKLGGAAHPLAHIPGAVTTVDGHGAKVQETSPIGQCKSMGGTRQLNALIVRDPGTAGVLYMTACLSNPTPEVRRQVLTSLGSLRDDGS